MRINVPTEELAPNLHEAIDALRVDYNLRDTTADARSVTFREMRAEQPTVRFVTENDRLVIEHTDLRTALRGLGAVLGADSPETLETEHSPFRTLGIMLDCSRNAVMNVTHFKRWLRRLALLGYNMAMLYTEDTYELPDEPYFGYMRGAYTPEELREIDQYARQLGIEMIPCIQTLGHLEQMFRWPVYRPINDTANILLVGEEQTYALIQKMLERWAEVFQSRRIHIGMDETHGLGRGKYLDRHGHRHGFEIFNEHLARVVNMCEATGYEPMIWSDMYFRLGSEHNDYYDPDSVIPEHVKQTIPEDAQLVYWDYYHRDQAFYEEWIRRHRALDKEPIVGTGAWTWLRAWHSTTLTERQAGPAVRACRATGVEELFVTMWGDDGAMCDYDSVHTGLAFIAELAFADDAAPARITPRFKAVCGGDYEASRTAGRVTTYTHGSTADARELETWSWMWDDPLLGIRWHNEQQLDPTFWDGARRHFEWIRDALADYDDDHSTAGNLAHARTIADWLGRKITLRQQLDAAYAQRDHEALRDVTDQARAIIELCQRYGRTLREQWLTRNKPFGLEVAQTRIAGHLERWHELIRRIDALIAGEIDTIPELDVTPAPPLTNLHPGARHVAKSSVSVI